MPKTTAQKAKTDVARIVKKVRRQLKKAKGIRSTKQLHKVYSNPIAMAAIAPLDGIGHPIGRFVELSRKVAENYKPSKYLKNRKLT